MEHFESFGDLSGDYEGLVNGDRAAGKAIGERLPFDELEDQVLVTVGLFKAVDRADAGVVERRQDLRFTLEAGESVGVLGEMRGKSLDRNLAVQSGVEREVDLPHAPPAEFAFDLEWADGGWVHERGVYKPNGADRASEPSDAGQPALTRSQNGSVFTPSFSVLPVLGFPAEAAGTPGTRALGRGHRLSFRPPAGGLCDAQDGTGAARDADGDDEGGDE